MHHRRAGLVEPRPSDGDLDVVAADIGSALDSLIDALVFLVPAPERWPVPHAALQSALQADPAWNWTERRVKEVLDRVRGLVPNSMHADLDDLDTVVRLGLYDSAEIGAAVMTRAILSRRARGEA